MSEFEAAVSLDDAFDYYEMTKRTVSKTPLFYYDPVKNEFIRIKSSLKPPCIAFINSYELCSKLIDDYLDQPDMKDYKTTFTKEAREAKNKIVSFLWFFEHIDGCEGFRKYEILRVTRELKKWCKHNALAYLEPEVYRII